MRRPCYFVLVVLLFAACHCFESRDCSLFKKDGQFLREKCFERDRTFEDCRIRLIKKSTIFENSHDIANKFAKLVVILMVHSFFDCLKIWNRRKKNIFISETKNSRHQLPDTSGIWVVNVCPIVTMVTWMVIRYLYRCLLAQSCACRPFSYSYQTYVRYSGPQWLPDLSPVNEWSQP